MISRISFLLIASCLLAACADAPVGSKKRPFAMYFVPSTDAEKITHSADTLGSYVSKYVSQKLYGKDEGFYVKTAIPSNYVALVEAFGTKKADFGVINTFSYILGKDIKKYDIEAVMTVIRGDGERTYKGQVIARADSGIKKIEDLKGKKFAFVDPASASGYILPSKLLKDHGVELGQTVFGYKHDNVVTMVYQKQVDAGATYYMAPVVKMEKGKKIEEIKDARARVQTQFPDIADKVKIIGYTEEVPNEPWVIRSQLYPDAELTKKVREAVIEGIFEFVKTDAGKELLATAATAVALVPVTDDAYAGIRKSVLESNIDLESTLKKQKS